MVWFGGLIVISHFDTPN